jgi:hypothetical protein
LNASIISIIGDREKIGRNGWTNETHGWMSGSNTERRNRIMTEQLPEDERLTRLRVLATSSIVGADLKWLLARLDKINMLACYATEEDTDARYAALIEIGKMARGEKLE